jgi:copper chaperone
MSTTAQYLVSGMTCDHCVRAVTTEVLSIPGVQSVDVALESEGTSTVTVVSDAPLTQADVDSAIDEAGYTLVSS